MNKLLLIVLIFFISACGGGVGKKGIRKEPVRPILSQLKKDFAQKHNVTNPDVMLIYGVGKKPSTLLTNNNYVNIINSSRAAKQFMQSSKIDKACIQADSAKKIEQLKDICLELKKNKIDISQGSLHSRGNNFSKLVKFHHKIGRFLPVLTPSATPQVTSAFGMRMHPVHKTRKFHYGIDLASQKRHIFSAAEGVVVQTGSNKNGYGNSVTIDHLNGFKTFYAHLDQIVVSKNQKVLQGELIATEGCSGAATGVHLHFEVVHKGKRIDPALLLGKSLR